MEKNCKMVSVTITISGNSTIWDLLGLAEYIYGIGGNPRWIPHFDDDGIDFYETMPETIARRLAEYCEKSGKVECIIIGK